MSKQYFLTLFMSLLLLLHPADGFVQYLQIHRNRKNDDSTKNSIHKSQQHKQLYAYDSRRHKHGDSESDLDSNNGIHQSLSSLISRQMMCRSILTTLSTLAFAVDSTTKPVNAAESKKLSNTVDDDISLTVVKTSSGLKYIDLMPGNGISPQYGNLCSIQYSAYIKLAKTPGNPNPQPELYDKVTDGYLIKHGNGRMIPGLDEGLHTMQVGGYRRIIIPPKLGYVDNGLGPIPEYPWQRYKLNSLLDQMVTIGAGTIIFEVKLLSVIDDEADQGYYQDDSLSPEDFDRLRENLRIKGLRERQKQQLS
jgi:FKBP-type peptidyl-prolyl cis-trans isomerase